MSLRFHKMHGLGNDFVVVDARTDPVAIDADRARAIADRHTGIGCDQIILIGPGSDTDVSMRIWNADGSEVAACGNATRCVPVLVGRDVSIRTAAGILHAALEGDGATVDMGKPSFDWNAIPLAYAMDTRALPLAWGELANPVAVNVGNPHVVFFVPDVHAVPLETLGPDIEYDLVFPERINVNIAHVLAPDHLVMRTWERGAGLTRACGTGACATFAAGRLLDLLAPSARLDLPGGSLRLAESGDGHLLMSGPATHVFTGEASL
ncbi:MULTISPECIES: diaminopimelate epimerase [Sphingomonadales]|uniref:Diaminopimelate epimerase n=2 Tax=Edaphosphingomonas TaxID=3423724 RepID=A0A2T4I6H3_9SPHN|nr:MULTISPECIES: diaminopimelate epimerase [Sphingomonas]AGH48347.1 diaminopimelate epimerase [Sphingomonas sp. MM-1]PTD26154.1 diaminopimelate epimerase [Sphingomonas fennica]